MPQEDSPHRLLSCFPWADKTLPLHINQQTLWTTLRGFQKTKAIFVFPASTILIFLWFLNWNSTFFLCFKGPNTFMALWCWASEQLQIHFPSAYNGLRWYFWTLHFWQLYMQATKENINFYIKFLSNSYFIIDSPMPLEIFSPIHAHFAKWLDPLMYPLVLYIYNKKSF